MRQLRRIIVLAPGTMLLVACASILDIGDPGFALREGGLATDSASEALPGPDPDGGDGGGGGDDAPGADDGGPQQCRPAPNVVCAGPCLDTTICSHCPDGTRNVAPLGKASAVSGGATFNLNNLSLGSGWFAPPGFTGPQNVSIEFSTYRSVQRVVVHGLRETFVDVDLVKTLTVEVHSLASPQVSPTLTTMPNGDVMWDLPSTPGVYSAIVHIISTTSGGAPGIAEIEVCGK